MIETITHYQIRLDRNFIFDQTADHTVQVLSQCDMQPRWIAENFSPRNDHYKRAAFGLHQVAPRIYNVMVTSTTNTIR